MKFGLVRIGIIHQLKYFVIFDVESKYIEGAVSLRLSDIYIDGVQKFSF